MRKVQRYDTSLHFYSAGDPFSLLFTKKAMKSAQSWDGSTRLTFHGKEKGCHEAGIRNQTNPAFDSGYLKVVYE